MAGATTAASPPRPHLSPSGPLTALGTAAAFGALVMRRGPIGWLDYVLVAGVSVAGCRAGARAGNRRA